ncbi:unnamed protein product [Rotaria socialis]|uniref:Kelch repeat protein n=1 Tax=Rotaria socialis TaxID=392032 RepID=A0A817NTS9_9BILA|nr:unnamed protein product [Rotaria socialis]
MSVSRWAHRATIVPHGYGIIGGGHNSSSELDSLRLYNSSSNTFMPISARMSMARYQHTATYIPSINAILFAGGWSAINGSLNIYEVFDISTLAFVRYGKMLSKREWYAATLLTTRVVLFSGSNNGITNVTTCEIYDPPTDIFTLASNMPFARRLHTATLMTSSGQVMVCGGQGTFSTLNSCEIYIP